MAANGMHRRLGSGELSSIAEKLYSGVTIKDRRHMFRMYKRTFVGSEAVECLLDAGLAPHDVAAVELGDQLLQAGVIKSATTDKDGSPIGFKNSATAFYRFTSALEPQASLDEDMSRRIVLDAPDLVTIISTLKQCLVVKDHTTMLRTFKECFEGQDAVQVLISAGLASSEDHAVSIGNALMQEGVVQHVTKSHSFKNADLLYRFTSKAEKVLKGGAAPLSPPHSARRATSPPPRHPGSPPYPSSPPPRHPGSPPYPSSPPPQYGAGGHSERPQRASGDWAGFRNSESDPFKALSPPTETAEPPKKVNVPQGRASWASGTQASFITRGGQTLSGNSFEHSGRRQALDNVHLHEFQQPLNCCNITAVAFACAALGIPNTVEDVFHYADLPASLIIDAGLTLADTYQVACKYVQGRSLPFRVELFFFDEGRLSEYDFAEQIAEVSLRRASSSKEVDMYLLNFNVNIAHGIQAGMNIGGGHFALLGGLDTDDHIVVADVNPKKYLRYWRCTPQRMFQAMQDKDLTSKRSRGCIRICHQDNPFVNPWPQEAVWNPPGLHPGIAAVDDKALNASMACGNITAIAYALSTLGHSTSLDDIFHTAQIPLRAVTDGNMTLADTFHTMVEVVQVRQLPVKVEIYHLDDDKVLPEVFWRCMVDGAASRDLVVILNFDIDTALGGKVDIAKHTSGGEYALVAAVDKDKEEVILASTQPRTFSRFWKVPVGRLFAACKKRDPTIGRGRGIIRVLSKHSNFQGPRPNRLTSAFMCEAADSALMAYNIAKTAAVAQRKAANFQSRYSIARGPVPISPRRAQFQVAGSVSQKAAKTLGAEGELGSQVAPTARVASKRMPNSRGILPSVTERPEKYDQPVNVVVEEDEVDDVTDTDTESGSQTPNLSAHSASFKITEVSEDDSVHSGKAVAVQEQEAQAAVAGGGKDELYTGSDPVGLAQQMGVYSGNPDRPYLFFTYGTLKQGFANRGKFEEALSMFLGPRLTKDVLPLVVPVQPTCLNAGCRLLHRACALGDQPGTGAGQVTGELYAVNQLTLDAFDILEDYRKDDPENSSYIRKPTAVLKEDGSEEVKCIMYYSSQTKKMLEEVDKGLANFFTTYSLDMAASQGYKRCCKMDWDHEGPHWHWAGPEPPKEYFKWDGHKANVLVACCASSAADKVPALVEELLATGKFNVKLVPSNNSKAFFQDGMRVLNAALKEDDIYYDHHEWDFEYTFGMPVVAKHLWLRDWADIMIIAPLTCNTLGKIVHGIGDNLVSAIVSAWEWKKKPFIAAPAMNSIMFDSPVCQRNLKSLAELGATVMGPRKARLSNGKIGIGAMVLVEDIVRFAAEATQEATKMPEAPTMAQLKSTATGKERWRLKVKTLAHALAISGWLFRTQLINACRLAANSDKGADAWVPVLATIKQAVRVDTRSESGDTPLHFAAGGEGALANAGERLQGNGSVDAVKLLIEKGADVNAVNEYGFTPLHVAVMNKLSGIVRVLLKAGADPLLKTLPGCPRPYVLAVEVNDARTMGCMMLWEEEKPERRLPEWDEIEKERAEEDSLALGESGTAVPIS